MSLDSYGFSNFADAVFYVLAYMEVSRVGDLHVDGGGRAEPPAPPAPPCTHPTLASVGQEQRLQTAGRRPETVGTGHLQNN